MKPSSLAKAGLIALGLSFAIAPSVHAQDVLTLMRGSSSSSINVAMNRAVVMESEVPFAELSVANPGIADIATLSDRTIYILGKTPGRTTLTLLGPDGRLITNVDVRVAPDIAEFKERLTEILPGEEIEVRTANDGIVLSGRVSGKQKLARALELGERYAPGRVTNLMTVGGTQQVMLKVRFAEMQRSVTKRLSSSLGFDGTASGIATEGGTNVFTNGQSTNLNFVDGDLSTTGTSATQRTGAFGFRFGAGGIQVALLLEALETKGLVRTLAEPNLVAISGQEATFLAGGEYPIPVVQDATVAIEYKPFGVELSFTPVVVDEDLVNLTISAKVSAIDTTNSITGTGGFTVNAFKTRETSTVVEMRDGQSFAIAGLLQDDFTDVNGQVPWIGDVPILGTLFRSADYSRQQSELVIIVTPHLVTATSGESLTLPTDRVRIPTESELFLLGKVAGDPGGSDAVSDVASQDFNGSYGYVME